MLHVSVQSLTAPHYWAFLSSRRALTRTDNIEEKLQKSKDFNTVRQGLPKQLFLF